MESPSSVATAEHPCVTQYVKNMNALLDAGFGSNTADAIAGIDFNACLDSYL